jgi:hypothetical protein
VLDTKSPKYLEMAQRHISLSMFPVESHPAKELFNTSAIFGGWAGRLGDLALGREAAYVPLSGNEVSFYVTRSLLVAIDCDGA